MKIYYTNGKQDFASLSADGSAQALNFKCGQLHKKIDI